MRRLRMFVVVVAVAVGLGIAAATPAGAVVLPFTGDVAIHIANLAPIVMGGAGVATVNGSGPAGHLTSLTFAASPFAVTGLVLPVTDPANLPIVGVQLTAHNGPGAFAGSGGAGFGGVMPILGAAKICLFGPGCASAFQNISVPLSVVGQGGAAFATDVVNLTVFGAPWTTGVVSINSFTVMGGVAPLSNTGAPSGTLSLVTPIVISTNIGASAVIPTYGVLTLHLIPEPGTLVLLASGIVGLIGWGRSRARD